MTQVLTAGETQAALEEQRTRAERAEVGALHQHAICCRTKQYVLGSACSTNSMQDDFSAGAAQAAQLGSAAAAAGEWQAGRRKEEEHKRALEAMQQSLREKEAEHKQLIDFLYREAAQMNAECDSHQE